MEPVLLASDLGFPEGPVVMPEGSVVFCDGNTGELRRWKDGELGSVWKIPAAGGKPQKLTSTKGEYLYPTWSPDGKHIAVASGSLETLRGDSIGANCRPTSDSRSM